MRTKQEVINFLESKVGTKVVCVGNPSLDGQCVTLIKSLMEYLGVPDPYKYRGHGKDCIAKYLSEGIAKPGLGFISVFSNKNMGGGYGHIWCNAGDGDGTFYESNGVKPLIVTKGKTYTYDNVCNFDSYIKEDAMADTAEVTKLRSDLVQALKDKESLTNQVNGWVRDSKNGTWVAKADVEAREKAEYQRGLKDGQASSPSPVLGWEENGLTIETTNGNEKRIVNYKRNI